MSRKDHDNYFYNYKFILLSILKTPAMCVHTSPRKYSPKCSKYFFSQCKRFCSIELTIRSYKWWAWVDLNYRPHPYQGCALTKLSYRP